ncbi:sugar kinase [Streptomyces pactum]|uniref:Sugar kinase n=1 Tax=Streptomyces pactum TaxID=68249 RepID=A0ABS0NFE8_9ACTN|nr:sugar kinase [Streptomyces pactum]MBH5333897.1 sugar kinase [Streptomyces pactum]
MTDVVTVGESLGLFRSEATGPLVPGTPVTFSFAGAESNVSIGLARLGLRVAMLGRVGDDPMGQVIGDQLRAEGVDPSRLVVDTDAPTAFMLRYHRIADRVVASYHRHGSAGSRLCRADVDEALVRSAKALHTTGITLGLSLSARDAVEHAVELARPAGVTVSLDINYRSMLWSRQDAAAALRSLIGRVDVVFGGEEELRLLTGETAPEAIAAAVRDLGPTEVVVKRGGRGAVALAGSETVAVPAVRVSCVDPVGAGDAFVAGYLSARLEGLDPAGRLRRGALCGAFAVSVPGDWEGLPHRGELGLLSGAEDVHR